MARKPKRADTKAELPPTDPVGPVRRLPSSIGLSLLLMGAGIFLVLMLTLAIWNERGFLAMWRMQHDVTELATSVRVLEQENETLWRDIERLRNDMGYIEKIAREELGLVRLGELVFEFVE